MTIRTNIKAGGTNPNHNERIERDGKTKSFTTEVESGDNDDCVGSGGNLQHDEKPESDKKTKSLFVNTGVKAGKGNIDEPFTRR